MSGGDWWVLGIAALPVAFFMLCAVDFWIASYRHQRAGENSRAIGCIYRAAQHATIAVGISVGACALIVL